MALKLLLTLCLGMLLSVVGRAQAQFSCLPYEFYAGGVRTMYVDSTDSTLYVGGLFTHVNGQPHSKIIGIRPDGSLKPMGPSVLFAPVCFIRWQGRMLVGGFGGLAELDGTVWRKIDSSMVVFAFYPMGNKLLIGNTGGPISSPNPTNILKEWDGVTMHQYKGIDSVVQEQAISAIIEYKGDVIVAGNIIPYSPTNPKFKDIMRWTGTKWDILGTTGLPGGGLDGVTDMVVLNGDLYVAGQFYESSGSPGNCIAKWDGTNWHRLGGGVLNGIYDLFVQGDTIIATGAIVRADGKPTEWMARYWNGIWCQNTVPVNNGTNGMINYFGQIIMYGNFDTVNGVPCSRLTKVVAWDDCFAKAAVGASAKPQNGYSLSPNPFTGTIQVRWATTPTDRVHYTLSDATGRAVWSAVSSNATLDLSLDVIASGLYMLRIVAPGGVVYIEKVVKK